MGARFSALVQTGPGTHPASCIMGTGCFPGIKSGRGVTLTPHPLLVPWLSKSRGIPLVPLCAVRPVQSLSACTRADFTFYLLFEDLWTFMIAPRRIILGMRNVSDESFRAQQNKHFVLSDIFLQIVTFMG